MFFGQRCDSGGRILTAISNMSKLLITESTRFSTSSSFETPAWTKIKSWPKSSTSAFTRSESLADLPEITTFTLFYIRLGYYFTNASVASGNQRNFVFQTFHLGLITGNTKRLSISESLKIQNL